MTSRGWFAATAMALISTADSGASAVMTGHTCAA
jgi:hypothetical protein